MFFIPLSCDIWLTPCAMANSDYYFSISYNTLALSSVILNKFTSQHWNKSFFKVKIPSFILIFYRRFYLYFYLYYLRSFRHLKFGNFFQNFESTAFFGMSVYQCISVLVLSQVIRAQSLNFAQNWAFNFFSLASFRAIMICISLNLFWLIFKNIYIFSKIDLALCTLLWIFVRILTC